MILEIYPCKKRFDFPHKTEAPLSFPCGSYNESPEEVQRENGEESLEFKTFSRDFIRFEREIS
jgi:hypothetical protein